jgi:hypothetical protein
MGNYSMGSMGGSMIGGMLGRDPESSGVAGGLGYAAGMALGFGPWGAAALGLASILGFGKKKPKPKKPDLRADAFGMPQFEWEAYMYNLYQHKEGVDSPMGSIYGMNWDQAKAKSSAMNYAPNVTDNRKVELHIHGGDLAKVKKVVTDVLNQAFGPMAVAGAR